MKKILLTMGFLGLALGACAQEIPATKMTIVMKDVLVEESYKRISEASGNLTLTQAKERKNPSLLERLTADEGPKLSFEASDEAYWSMIRRYCEANEMAVVQPPDLCREAVYLMPGSATTKMPTAMSGGCMVQIKKATVIKNQNFKDAPNGRLQLEMILCSEPKAGIIKAAQTTIVEKALTDEGKSLAIESKGDPTFVDAAYPTFHRFNAELKYEMGIKTLKTLSGKMWVIQEVKSESWVVGDASKAVGATKTCCDLDTVKITKWALENNFIVLEGEIISNLNESLLTPDFVLRRLKYEGPQGPLELQHLLNNLSQRQEGGKMIRQFKIQSYRSGFDMKMPEKMTFRLPSEVRAVQVPFEFSGVPLP